MKIFKKAFAITLVALTLAGCGFVEIKSDTDIIKPEEEPTTSTNVTLEVPEVTTPEPEVTTPTDTSTEVSTEPEEPASPYPMEMKTTANVNARKDPSTAGEIIQIVPEGTTVKAVGFTDGWYEVDLDGEKAYIIENYVEEINDTQE